MQFFFPCARGKSVRDKNDSQHHAMMMIVLCSFDGDFMCDESNHVIMTFVTIREKGSLSHLESKG